MDPFAVFGDDDIDDENVVGTLAKVYQRPDIPVAPRITASPTVEQSSLVEETTLRRDDILQLPWYPPLYKSKEIEIVQSLEQFGGQRGFIATQRISPGTLLLIEEPLVAWDFDAFHEENANDSFMEIIENCITMHPNLPNLLKNLDYLHPTKAVVDSCLQQPPPDESIQEQVIRPMEELRQQYEYANSPDRMQQLLDYLPSGSTMDDIFRLVLVLRYNGLETGLYLYAALLNHADAPNCVKFRPSSETTSYSEVRATRAIARHEPLTISYVPRILSWASRRRYLWQQHRFDCLEPSVGTLRDMERVRQEWPVRSSMDDGPVQNSITSPIESSIAELESLHDDEAWNMSLDSLATLEQRCWELCHKTMEEALENEHHVLWIPARTLHVNICYSLLNEDLSFAQRMALLQRLVASAQHLRELQHMFLGPDHFDLAKTNLDLVQAVEELMSRSPRHLPGGVPEWSARVFAIRTDYERIKALYPENANDFIEEK